MHYGLTIGSHLAIAGNAADEKVSNIRNRNGGIWTPAVVQVRDDEILVGKNAVREKMLHPEKTVKLTPSSVSDEAVLQAEETDLTGVDVWVLLAEHAIAGTLSDNGQSNTTVVVPDTFGYDDRRSVYRVVRELGASKYELVDQSVTACVCTEQLPPPGAATLVCHLSKTALSCSIVAHGPNGLEVVDAVRDTSLGTDAIRKSLYGVFRERMLDEGFPDPDDNDPLRFDVFENINAFREALDEADEASIGVNIGGGEVFTQTITRAEAVKHCADYLSDVADFIQRVSHSPIVDARSITVSDTAVLVAHADNVFPLADAVSDLDFDPVVNSEPGVLAKAAAQLSAGEVVLPGPTTTTTDDAEDIDDSSHDQTPAGEDSAAEETTQSPADTESSTPGKPNFEADDPFEVLGLPRTTPFQEIKQRATELIGQYDSDEEINAIGDAIDEIQDGLHIKRVGDTVIEPVAVETNPSTVHVRETVSVTVTDIHGNPIEDATVELDGRRMEFTDQRGTVEIEPLETGTHTVEATKTHPDDGHEFRTGTTSVDVETRHASLSFAACPSSTTVGEIFELAVTDEDRPVSGAVVLAPDESVVTGGDGTAELSLSSSGAVTLLAKKERTASSTYQPTTATVTVHPRELSLDISAPSSVSAESTHEITVVDPDGDGVPDVRVALPDTTVLTDKQGVATVYFDAGLPDTVTLVASKPDTAETVYDGDETDVSVTHSNSSDEKALSVQTDTAQATVGEPVTYEVTDERGISVESVYVSGTDGNSDLTDSDGKATIIFKSPGNKTVSASPTDGGSHGEYNAASHTITVHRRLAPLTIRGLPTTTVVGEPVEITVRTEAGDPVPDATVEIDGSGLAQTDDNGTAELSFENQGERTVRVSKQSSGKNQYEPVSEVLDVYAKTLDFGTCPNSVTAGEQIQVRLVDNEDNPVAGAVVKTPNHRSGQTTDDGTTEFTVEQNGVTHVTAVVPDAEPHEYSEAVETLRVHEANSTGQ